MIEEKYETYAEITAELRSVSRGAKGSGIYAKYCESQPTVFGKPIGIYLADIADRIDACAMHEGILRVPTDVWNSIARRVEAADDLFAALDVLTYRVGDYLAKGLIQLPLPIEEAYAKARNALSMKEGGASEDKKIIP